MKELSYLLTLYAIFILLLFNFACDLGDRSAISLLLEDRYQRMKDLVSFIRIQV